MGWFWADDNVVRPSNIIRGTPPRGDGLRKSGEGGCPVVHTAPSAQSSATGRCPVDHGSAGGPGEGGSINPLNMMPSKLSQGRVSEAQGVHLPTDREISTIPKSRDGERWEYPSAQQLYNAMVRKGYSQSGEHVESMLSVHNFLNEGAWREILDWESRAAPGSDSSLMRFTGRPNTLSPKAYLYSTVWGGQTPFDRHDWFVDRGGREVRYVIDYYEAPNDEHDEPVFYLDIRPALDTPGAAFERIRRWSGETWSKAAGRGGASE